MRSEGLRRPAEVPGGDLSRVTIPKAAVVGRAHSHLGCAARLCPQGWGGTGRRLPLQSPSRRCCFWRNHMWHFEASEDHCVESWRL